MTSDVPTSKPVDLLLAPGGEVSGMARAHSAKRTQAERSASTKGLLIDAAVDSLVELGYGRTTTAMICARAGLTRGAYHHHYARPAELFIDVLEQLYKRLEGPAHDAPHEDSLEALIRGGWSRVRRPEFKALLELWLACRNDPELGRALAPRVADLQRKLFDPASPGIARAVHAEPKLIALYRLASETLIALGMGRATSRDGGPVGHEEQVIELLLTLARDADRQASAVDSKR